MICVIYLKVVLLNKSKFLEEALKKRKKRLLALSGGIDKVKQNRDMVMVTSESRQYFLVI